MPQNHVFLSFDDEFRERDGVDRSVSQFMREKGLVLAVVVREPIQYCTSTGSKKTLKSQPGHRQTLSQH